MFTVSAIEGGTMYQPSRASIRICARLTGWSYLNRLLD